MSTENQKIVQIIKSMMNQISYEEALKAIPEEYLERIQKEYFKEKHRAQVRIWKFGDANVTHKRGRKPLELTPEQKKERAKLYRENYKKKHSQQKAYTQVEIL